MLMARARAGLKRAAAWSVAAIAAALLAAGGARAEGESDWAYYAGNAAFQKYSPLAEITRDNIAGLGIAWVWESPDRRIDEMGLKDPGGRPVTSFAFRAGPLVLDGVLYVRTAYSMVAAVDARDGKTLWVFDPKAYEKPVPANFGHTSHGLAYWKGDGKGRLILLTSDGRLFALGLDGKPIAEFGTNGETDVSPYVQMPDLSAAPPQAYAFYTPPTVCGDTIVVGFSDARGEPVYSEAYGALVPNWPRGDVQAFDARTGKHKWTFHTIPRKGEFGAETWAGPEAELHAGKANVWSSISCDESLGLAYLPVAAPSENFIGVQRRGDNLFSQSVVAVDAETGERRWHYQTIHHGLWDYDLVAAPTLMDVAVGGKPVKALAQISKSGFVFVLDRETGKPVWPIEERPVPPSPLPGETVSPTQPIPTRPSAVDVQAPLTDDKIVDLTPKLQKDARAFVARLGRTSIYTPSGTEPTLFLPGVGGGPNWTGAAFDPQLSYLFVPSRTAPNLFSFETIAKDDPGFARSLLGFKRVTELRRALPNGFPVTKPPYSRITAIDMTTGETAWIAANGHGYNKHPALEGRSFPPLGSGGQSGVLATAGLVFSADDGGTATSQPEEETPQIRAFDKRTGEVVWEQDLPYSYSGGPPISYRAGGKQFVVVALGGDARPTQWAPGYLVAYALGGDAAPPPGTADGGTPAPPPSAREGTGATGAPASGEELFTSYGCVACHGEGRTPLVALDLYAPDQLAAIIRHPPSELMPPFDIPDDEMARLTKYLRETYK